jgi:hypothetical protein
MLILSRCLSMGHDFTMSIGIDDYSFRRRRFVRAYLNVTCFSRPLPNVGIILVAYTIHCTAQYRAKKTCARYISIMNRPAASRERRSGRSSEFEQVSIIHQTIDERYEMNDAPLPITPSTTHHDTDEFSSRDDFLNTMSLRKVLMEHDFYCKSKRSGSHTKMRSDLDELSPPSSGSGKGKVLVGKKKNELDNSHHDTHRKSYASLSLPSSPGNNSSSGSSCSSDDLDTSHHQRRPYHGPQF